jgi:spore maturation protein CgeB
VSDGNSEPIFGVCKHIDTLLAQTICKQFANNLQKQKQITTQRYKIKSLIVCYIINKYNQKQIETNPQSYDLGAGGRVFESLHPDTENQGVTMICSSFFIFHLQTICKK